MRSRELQSSHLGCCVVAATALLKVGEVEAALSVMEEGEELAGREGEEPQLLSSLHLIRGRIFEAMDDRPRAAEAFEAALKADVFCWEAWEALVGHSMLTAQEERDLMKSLPFQSEAELGQLAAFLYSAGLRGQPGREAGDCLPSTQLDRLRENADVRVGEAERLYYSCEYQAAVELSTEILRTDPTHPACLPVHIALLVELDRATELFRLAHQLVDLYPEWAVAWYAVGSYYYLTGRQDPARRFLSKATQLDRMFGPAWLTYGHSFAVENEHDQATQAYFKGCQLMPGCHLPPLYVGLEYSLTNNQVLAQKFFSQALQIAPNDPFVLHELGVAEYQAGNYERAERLLSDALLRVERVGRGAGLPAALSGISHIIPASVWYEQDMANSMAMSSFGFDNSHPTDDVTVRPQTSGKVC